MMKSGNEIILILEVPDSFEFGTGNVTLGSHGVINLRPAGTSAKRRSQLSYNNSTCTLQLHLSKLSEGVPSQINRQRKWWLICHFVLKA